MKGEGKEANYHHITLPTWKQLTSRRKEECLAVAIALILRLPLRMYIHRSSCPTAELTSPQHQGGFSGYKLGLHRFFESFLNQNEFSLELFLNAFSCEILGLMIKFWLFY